MKPVLPARINFRPVLFAAFGLAFGIFLFFKIKFGALRASDFLLCALFLCGIFRRPVRFKSAAAVFCAFALFASVGAGLAFAQTARFSYGVPAGEYKVSGRVISAAEENGYSSLLLDCLYADGTPSGGKLRLRVGQEGVKVGDIVAFTATLKRAELPQNGMGEDAFASDLRYTASVSICEVTDRTKDPFLLLNAKLYETLHENMEKDEADIAYALLTGNGRGLDGEFSEGVRKGGIAHIFAVSGLHIGILYGAAYLLFKPLRRWRFIPAAALALCYSALCAFSVSSLRAVCMCTTAGALRAMGAKRDFLESIALAAVIVLVLFPAQWLAVGFRLSFGACLGLALFAGSFSRALSFLPKPLSRYLSANVSVQLFTFPILIESFGYWSVWGTLLNFFVIPCLPVLFLGLLVCALFASIVPPAAAFVCLFPEGMLSLMTLVLSVSDFSFVLTGFSLGAGATVWYLSCVLLSERLRLARAARAGIALLCAIGLTVCILAENAVFYGCKISVYRAERGGCAALVRTSENAVLLIDDEISLSSCKEFLSHTYGGTLTAVAILGEEEGRAINVAAFLGAEEVWAREKIETGLRETNIVFQETFTVGEAVFRYEGKARMILFAEDCSAEFAFFRQSAYPADLFVNEGCGGLIFFLHGGIIKSV